MDAQLADFVHRIYRGENASVDIVVFTGGHIISGRVVPPFEWLVGLSVQLGAKAPEALPPADFGDGALLLIDAIATGPGGAVPHLRLQTLKVELESVLGWSFGRIQSNV